MKVITIKQPYATLIAEGYKKYEFRTWKTNYRGDILIHAGKTVDKKALERFKDYNLTYPTGCIVAKATLTDVEYVDDDFIKAVALANPLVYKGIIDKKDWKGYGFKLENVKKLKQTVQIKGQLGLWNYEKEIK